MSKSKFVSQQERYANLHPKIKESLTDFKKENYQEEEYQYFSENNNLQDWNEYEATLNKETITELIIKPNHFKFENNKLTIKQENYPNLKTLYACGLGLREVELDCPSLENLYLANNSLTELDLSKVLNLRNLVVNGNKLGGTINLDILKYLEEAYFQHNLVSFFSVKTLPNLRTLNVSFNDVLGLFLENLDNLEILDADFNLISEFNFPSLPNLEMLSLRGNGRKSKRRKKLFLRSPKIAFLDYHRTNIEEVEHVLGYNPDQLRICNAESYQNADGTYNPDVATEWEDRVYQMHQKREEEWINGEWGFAFEDNESKTETTSDENKTTSKEFPNCRYRIPNKKDTIVDHDISHRRLTGKLIIENWPSLRSLNVGDNRLQALVIRNCPNLTRLIYSHNAMPEEAVIENCPNLQEKDSYKHDEYVQVENEEISEAEKNKIESEELRDEANDKVYAILERNRNGENISLDELYQLLNEIDLNLVDSEYRKEYLDLYQIKLKEEFPEQFRKKEEQEQEQEKEKKTIDLQKLGQLITKAKKALQENNLNELEVILTEMENYCNTEAYTDNKEVISSLKQQLQELSKTSTKNQASNNEPLNITLIISLSVVVIIGILVGYLFSKKKKNNSPTLKR